MITTLCERWKSDTCTFWLLTWEIIITLEDVYHILHLPVSGWHVTLQDDMGVDSIDRASL